MIMFYAYNDEGEYLGCVLADRYEFIDGDCKFFSGIHIVGYIKNVSRIE